MSAFPRTVLPTESTWPLGPTAMSSRGLSGKIQLRDVGAVGHVWTETYTTLLLYPWSAARAAEAQKNQAWLAQLEQLKARGTIFTIYHPQRTTLFGVGGGTPLVNGANQTGASLAIKGLPLSTSGVFKAGDIITVAGLNPVLEFTADVNSDGSGNATTSIEPPIPAGSSPADGAAITTNATPGSVLYRARLADLQRPRISVAQYLSQLVIAIEEMP